MSIDVHTRRDGSPSAAEKSHIIRVVSARHAARPPSASVLDLALPNYRYASARIPVTTGVAWYLTAHSCATSDTKLSRMGVYIRKSSYSVQQLINQAIIQQERINNSWYAAAETNQLERMC
jgi:hypothetical protein